MGSKRKAPNPATPEDAALYLVPTPLGDPDDITLRALRILAEVEIVAAEDTRVIARLLRRHQIHAPRVLSYHDHNEDRRAAWLAAQIEAGHSVALVSDAGTPLVGDPGFRLVQATVARGIRVVSLPGPCAVITALAASGLPSTRFQFLGFLPRKPGPRRAAIRGVRMAGETLVFFEAPHRALDSLRCLVEELGDRHAALGWNLSKPNERMFHGTLSNLLNELSSWEFVHGEMTFVVAGAAETGDAELQARAQRAAEALVARGLQPRFVTDVLVELTGVDRKGLYRHLFRHGPATVQDDPPPDADE